MFNGSVCVWDKAVPNPAAAPVASDMSPTNFDAVTTPENDAFPVDLMVAAEPTSNPIEWTLLKPVLKLEKVATPTDNTSFKR